MKDNFSKQADNYVKYRPSYPAELFDFIMSHVQERKMAWDCATGNGQSAKELARYFDIVYATDISQNQLDNAKEAPNIFYSLQPAEQTDFPDNSFDLVTVSQALHWFDFEKFYAEVKRVGKPGSLIACWMYGKRTISPAIDAIISKKLYQQALGTYWDDERKFVDENYTTIPFPFKEITSPIFRIEFEWTSADLEGYLNTWSALQKFIAQNNYNPVDEIMKEIQTLWEGEKMKVFFPIYMRMGRIEKL